MKFGDLQTAFKVRPGYWFAPKMFGLGATPVTWQGWALVAGFLAAVLGLARWVADDATKIAAIFAITLPFVVVVWLKTDGGWRWHWGWRR
ncbi:hypothetical protein [Sphingomonas sp. 28-63-12]|uniref:hypothetical protein n=1 Tax=Sphingomonas sp. 28-63-12 TaxID=1970434 RepID=UPI000BDD77D2|nr:MAG: hypothetical protein B7Y47_06955 [Sphingomonas sp. 28-63-12]